MIKWFKKRPITIRAAIISGLFLIITTAINVSFFICYTEKARKDSELINTELQKLNQRNSQLWRLTEVNLRNWVEVFDRQLHKSLDSVRITTAARLGVESGAYVKNQLEFLISKRIERDNTIDSFMVAYAIQGGDTTKLSIRRKLPVNARKITQRRHKDYGPHYKGVILDTL